jgi:hypothetical protein
VNDGYVGHHKATREDGEDVTAVFGLRRSNATRAVSLGTSTVNLHWPAAAALHVHRQRLTDRYHFRKASAASVTFYRDTS